MIESVMIMLMMVDKMIMMVKMMVITTVMVMDGDGIHEECV